MSGDLILLSGGMDSAAVAKSVADKAPRALFCDYGQPHLAQEILAAGRVAKLLGLELEHVRVQLSGVFSEGVVVPHRNAVLIALAANAGAQRVWIGCCRADYEVFEDCRAEYLSTLGAAIGVEVVAPLLQSTKAEIREMLGEELLGVTWSCYFPQVGELACDERPACIARLSDA